MAVELPTKYQNLVKNSAKNVKKLLKVSSYYGVSFMYAVEDVYNLNVRDVNSDDNWKGLTKYNFNNHQITIFINSNGYTKNEREYHLAHMMFHLLYNWQYLPDIDWHFSLTKPDVRILEKRQNVSNGYGILNKCGSSKSNHGMELLANQFATDLMNAIHVDKYSWY